MPPLLFTDDETIAVALGLLTATMGGVGGLEEAALRAFTKLEQLVPSRLKGRLKAFEQSTSTLVAQPSTTVDAQRLAFLAGACRDRTEVRATYRNRDEEPSERRIDPHRLVCTGRRWYLLCWDQSRDDWRTLRVDRFVQVELTGQRFVERPIPRRLNELMSDALGNAPYTHRARIRYHAPLTEVEKQVSPSAGRLEAEGPKSCLLHTGSMSLDALAIYVAVKGFDFEVLDPPELIAHVRVISRRFAKAARAARSSPGL